MTPSSGERPSEPNEEILDLRGEVCPYTFVRTRLALEAREIGARLRVIVDHEPATRNLPRSLREWGQEVESLRSRDGGAWAITVVKRQR